MLRTLSNNLPLWSPEDEGAGGGDAAEGEAAAGAEAEVEAGAEGEAEAEVVDEAKAARAAELAAMSPEDRAAAEAADAEDEAEEARLAVVPEDGEYELTMPEGVELDAELMAELGPQFAEMGLSTGQAQSLADKFIAAQTARGAKQQEAWQATLAGWVDTAKADPEMGGAKWDATAEIASNVVTRFGTPALKEYLNASGGVNHPEMIRFMAKVGAMIGEDNLAISETPGAKVKADTASILYPNDTPKGK